jgi:signal transduction histidine kinase
LSALGDRLVGTPSWDPRSRSVRKWLPPVERREFWAIQALVLALAVIHSWVEFEHLLGERSPLYLFPTTLYLIPCIYAAVVFGVRGALLTALWAAALVVLNLLVWHEGLERLGELVQVTWIGVVAVFVGSRVDRERAARHEAEQRESVWRTSEERYRAIMDNVEEPILLLDDQSRVLEANRSAAALLAQSVDEMRGQTLSGPTGRQIEERLLAGRSHPDASAPIPLGDPPGWFEMVPLASPEHAGTDVVQLVLRDVTSSYEREQGLEFIVREALADREEEQQRIARDLHDGPLQSLMQLWRSLESLSSVVPEPERDSVVSARDAVGLVADELRRFGRDLRPSVLDDLGISAAIRSEAESLEQRAGMDVTVRVTGTARRLEEDVELGLLRITQEAVRNIERHSQASRVAILLEFERARVRLVISDDGVGLDPVPTASELLSENHLGLIGMQERARLANGRLELTSQSGEGLTVEVVLRVNEIPH